MHVIKRALNVLEGNKYYAKMKTQSQVGRDEKHTKCGGNGLE